jgi:hypothetical protein
MAQLSLDQWITLRLGEDPDSPWHALVYCGGARKKDRIAQLRRPVSFTTLQSGVRRTLAKSLYISDLTDPAAQYAIVRNFWTAVRATFGEEWAQPGQYLLLDKVGIQSLSLLAGTIIDRCIADGSADADAMTAALSQTRDRLDWRRETTTPQAVRAMTGNRVARRIAADLAQTLTDHTGRAPLADLQQQLLTHAQTSRVVRRGRSR